MSEEVKKEVKKVFLPEDQDSVYITCPKCEFGQFRNLGKFKGFEKELRLRAKCPCGNVFPIIIDRRQNFRKNVKFPGYIKRGVRQIPVTITNLSRTGLRFETHEPVHLDPKYPHEVCFDLVDGHKKKHLCKIVEVRNVFMIDRDYGVQFRSVFGGGADADIGFYLMR